jgi:molybdopterin converting factor small subunit
VSVEFTIPGPLRPFAGNQGRVAFEGSAGTVGEALAGLWSLYPGLRDRVLTEEGAIRPHVNIFLDADNVRDLGGLAARLPAGSCEIAILPAVSGGIEDGKELKIED